MDKQTLSNYGWVVIAVLVLAVMIALATPFGEYIKAGVESTTQGLFDTSEKALNVVGASASPIIKPVENVLTKYEHISGYVNSVGKTSSSTVSKYIRVPVNSGENWYISYPVLSRLHIGNGALRFEDANKSLVSYIDALAQPNYRLQSDTNKSGIVVTIPEGVSFMCVNLKLSSFDYTETAFIGNLNKSFKSTWLAIGDSLTFFGASANQNWLSIASNQLSAKVYNNAQSGHGYLYDGGFIEHINTDAENVELVVIFGSFNDMASDAAIGICTDTYVVGGENTLAACMNNTYDYVQNAFPDAKIAVIAPTPWSAYRPEPATTDRSIKAQQYVAVMQEICESRNIPFLDLFHNSGLTPWDIDFNNQYYSNADGCHPNDEGHKIIAPIMTEFIKSVLNN